MMPADAVFFRDLCETPAALAAAVELTLTLTWVTGLFFGHLDFCTKPVDILGAKSSDTKAEEEAWLNAVVVEVTRAGQVTALRPAPEFFLRITADRAIIESGHFVDFHCDHKS